MKIDGLKQQTKRRFLTHSNDVSTKVFFIVLFSSILLTGSLFGPLTVVNPLNQYVLLIEA
jgi:hypothetical protein